MKSRELSHIEQPMIQYIRAKARNLRGLQYAQARRFADHSLPGGPRSSQRASTHPSPDRSAVMARAIWKLPEYANTYTRRGEVKQGCRNAHHNVTPAWVKRNGEYVLYRWRYWDGVTEHHPGKWDGGYADDLRSAKRKAKKSVEDGQARHGCEVTLECMTWGHDGMSYSQREVWSFGQYVTEVDR